MYWISIDSDIKKLVQIFPVRIILYSVHKITRLVLLQMHAQKVSDLMIFFVLYVRESRTNHKYIMIIKDEF